MNRKRVLIMGAAGRDFHNFNLFFRDKEEYEVVGFTAEQIPNIVDRKYPAGLSGKLYPEGIPIFPEADLVRLIKEKKVEQCIFAYSDVSYDYVMQRSAIAMAAGADFRLLGPMHTMLKSHVPVISVGAVRTGCGKSQTSRSLVRILVDAGKNVVAVRHPMPYGDLQKQVCQRFACYDDLDKYECTIEEREEYEAYLDNGLVVYAGVDYEKIVSLAEKEAEIIVWDGGNNDWPFYVPDFHIVLADPHRPGHETAYYPGEINARMADLVLITKVNTAKEGAIKEVEKNIAAINPGARILRADSIITADEQIKGRVLVIEDGPTLTHGGMSYGAGVIAANKHGCELVDPRPYAAGSLKQVYEKYPHLGKLLPAIGYSWQQLRELEESIERADAELVLAATPIDLSRVIAVSKKIVRIRYELGEDTKEALKTILLEFLRRHEP